MIDRIHSKNLLWMVSLLVPLTYIVVISFSVSNEWFSADDRQELVFVRGMPSLGTLFGPDVFGLFRPIKNLLFRLFVAMSPLGVRSCRLVGIFIGAISFFPVQALCRRILGNGWKSVAAASIWLLSPTLVSSAAWLSCVNIQIMAALSALALVCHDSAWNEESFRPRWVAAAALCLFFALLSYECSIAVVPLFFLFDLYLRPVRIQSRSAWLCYVSYAGVAIVFLSLRHIFCALTVLENYSLADATRWQLVVSSPWFTWQHFASWFWPFGRFTVFADYRWGQVSLLALFLCAVVFLGILVFALIAKRRFPVLGFSILFSLVAFAPVSNCLGLRNGPYGDYYLTLSSIGLAICCVEVISLLLHCKDRKRMTSVFVACLFVAVRLFSVPEAARWAKLWGSGELAIAESVKNFPDSCSNMAQQAMMFCDSGQFDEALRLGRQVEIAVGADSPLMCNIHLIRALHALRVERNAEKALGEIELSSRTDGTGGSQSIRHYYKGCIFEDIRGDEATAETEYRTALDRKWTVDLVPCADRLARLKAIQGERDEAISLWERAMMLDPNNTAVLWNLSIAYREAGEKARSNELREKVRQLSGN